MDAIDVTSFMSSPLASAIHITLALFLLFGGIATMKKWHAGCDISNKTFLILVLPCPVCMSALLVSCVALSTVVEFDGILIGAIVGIVFILSIIVTTLVMKNLRKITKILKINFEGTPDTLGAIMVFIGLFYLIAAIMIPAYINAGAARTTSSGSFGTAELLILGGTILLIAFGAILTRAAERKHVPKKI